MLFKQQHRDFSSFQASVNSEGCFVLTVLVTRGLPQQGPVRAFPSTPEPGSVLDAGLTIGTALSVGTSTS